MSRDSSRPRLRRGLLVSVLALAVGGLGGLWADHGALVTGLLVAAPSALGVAIDKPGDVREGLEIARGEARVRAWVFEPSEPARGTVLVLHGIRSSKLHLVGSAREHARNGLRAIAVDSRGHGESAGRYLTYGVEEALDLRALIDDLEARGRLAQPLAIVGSSYGAATALQHAAIDPRVERVVAIAPFASLREVVPAYLRWKLGALAQLVPSAWVDARIDQAAAIAGFDPDRACPRCVAPEIRASVLLIHSRADERIPWQHSAAIHEALEGRAELMLVDGVAHVLTGRAAGVAERIRSFLTAGR